MDWGFNMWLFTKIGFFSVVQKPWDIAQGTLTVRARVRYDLENFRAELAKLYPDVVDLPEIEVDFRADYHYRIQVHKSSAEKIIGELAYGIDYDNFKQMIAKEQGEIRAGLYARVWQTLLSLRSFAGRVGGITKNTFSDDV